MFKDFFLKNYNINEKQILDKNCKQLYDLFFYPIFLKKGELVKNETSKIAFVSRKKLQFLRHFKGSSKLLLRPDEVKIT